MVTIVSKVTTLLIFSSRLAATTQLLLATLKLLSPIKAEGRTQRLPISEALPINTQKAYTAAYHHYIKSNKGLFREAFVII